MCNLVQISSIKKIKGATMVEYAIMVSAIAIVCFAIIGLMGISVRDLFQTAVTTWTSAK
jgi:Flp pilus assembly pilin Flp